MDPRHGELSRALRNRGIEICILGEVNIGDPCIVESYYMFLAPYSFSLL